MFGEGGYISSDFHGATRNINMAKPESTHTPKDSMSIRDSTHSSDANRREVYLESGCFEWGRWRGREGLVAIIQREEQRRVTSLDLKG